ncbi:50S ribosomal protein L21 [bacterium]|nr:50S ribosomal protein L21 [bacterium]
MYAVVNIKGFQYKLEKGETIRVPRFDLEVGKKVKLSEVLLIADGEKITIGKPFVEGAVVEATITDQGKYDKVIVFKKMRRKDYSVKRGHRQDFSELSVDKIKISASKRAAKAAEDTPETPKTDNAPPVAEAQEDKS